jgi:hypothetical protein
MHRSLTEGLDAKIIGSVTDNFERLLISNIDEQASDDIILSKKTLLVDHPSYNHLIENIKQKYGYNITNRLQKAFRYADIYLKDPYDSCDPTITLRLNKNTIIIGQYKQRFKAGQLDMLLEKVKNDDVVLATMIMRYASLLYGTRHWSAPLAVFKLLSEEYGAIIEGFCSPMSWITGLINKNSHFCSLFKDTDQPFGSYGSFFETDFNGTTSICNPPAVLSIMESTVEYIFDQLDKAIKPTTFYLSVSRWTDTLYYSNLEFSKYNQYKIELRAKTYYSVDNTGNAVLSKVDRTFFVLSNDCNINFTVLKRKLLLAYKNVS